MSWLICWISREARILHSPVPMISSTFQRSPRKICGLFDSGFAGDADDLITSSILNAPVTAVHENDPLSDLGPDGQSGVSLYPSTSGMKAATTEKQVVTEADNDWLDDLDSSDLAGDPLGDDSMEAFINLEKFLDGNSFFDEEGNLNIPEEKQKTDQQVVREAAVAPVIDFMPEATVDPTIDFLTGSDPQDFLLLNEQTKVMGGKKASRKRTAGSMTGLKTSLYEIPARAVIPEVVQEGSTPLSDTELDHDYSTKRQRLSVPDWNDNTPSTSGAVTNIAYTSSDAVQLLDDSMDKQTIRRIKNNHASKRSREQRKQKFVEMDMEAEELVVRNQQLREKIVELEQLAKEMKAMLVAKMAGRAV